MKFEISQEIFEKFPGLNIGAVIAKAIDNQGTNDELMDLLKKQEEFVEQNYMSSELSQNPKIECWRKAYSSFGAKPKKYKCSIEALMRQVLSGNSIRHISKLVDLYNYLSLKHMLPMGADDLNKVEGDIVLKFTKGDEKYIELGMEELKNPKPGEVAYMDNVEVLCRRWNWRECEKTKIEENSKNVILYVEGLPPVTKEEIEDATNEVAELVEKYCGGNTEKYILDKNNSSIKIVI